jgi:hypothetical protein
MENLQSMIAPALPNACTNPRDRRFLTQPGAIPVAQRWNAGWPLLLALLFLPLGSLQAQQEKVAAFKQALAQNQKRLEQYKWIETTIISMKGDEKSRIQKQCSYGPDGKVQKQQISAPVEQKSPGGLRGKIAAKKKGEITEYMQQAVALVHQYVPPDPQRIQAAKDSGKLSFSPMGAGAARLDFHDFVKAGDNMTLNIDLGSYALQAVNVASYLDSQEDAITLQVNFASLKDGVSYPAQTVLDAPEKKIQVVVQNSDYQRIAPAAPAPAAGVLPLGTVVPTLPAGCVPTAIGGVQYYHCGENYYRAVLQGSTLVYVTARPQ